RTFVDNIEAKRQTHLTRELGNAGVHWPLLEDLELGTGDPNEPFPSWPKVEILLREGTRLALKLRVLALCCEFDEVVREDDAAKSMVAFV
ncbi:hypothetical protein, partial [Pseudomonas sp. AH2 (2023)]|uniref:hypothetical protein n=1 Tax=Pseudomonas sp. AH2 (2023) TaxID=3048599 RepID=UPI002B223019